MVIERLCACVRVVPSSGQMGPSTGSSRWRGPCPQPLIRAHGSKHKLIIGVWLSVPFSLNVLFCLYLSMLWPPSLISLACLCLVFSLCQCLYSSRYLFLCVRCLCLSLFLPLLSYLWLSLSSLSLCMLVSFCSWTVCFCCLLCSLCMALAVSLVPLFLSVCPLFPASLPVSISLCISFPLYLFFVCFFSHLFSLSISNFVSISSRLLFCLPHCLWASGFASFPQ